MHLRKWAYYGILTAAAVVFLFSTVKLTAYFMEAHQSSKEMKVARNLFYNETSSTLQGPKPPIQENVSNVLPKDTSIVTTVYQTTKSIQDQFKPLLKINSDVIGWVKIDDTLIDYPVVQAADNEYYLSKDLNQKNNVNGSIFLDYRNHIDKDEKHWILYGHNMKNKSMFMALLNYESKWYFDHHSIIDFDTLYGNKKWRVFSAYFTNTSEDYLRTDFKTNAEYKDFIKSLQEKSLHSTKITLYDSDTVLTLSTCSNTHDGARFVVHAKLIP
jgi:sortase B